MPHDQPVIPVTASDGHRFDLIHVPADDARAALLFIPGMGLSARQYIALGLALAERGIESWIHEWRGLGSSSLRAGRSVDWGYRELLDLDLRAAMDAVESVAGSKPLLIGGHSLGSQFALMLAGRRQRSPDALVLVAGGSPHWRLYPLKHRSLLLPVFIGLPLLGTLFGHYPGRQVGFAGREARGVMRDWTWTGRHGHYGLPNLDPSPTPGMEKLRIPILGIRMADDWFVPKASLEGLLAHAPECPTRQVVIDQLPGGAATDHFAWLRSPAPVVERMAEFLQEALDEAAANQSD